MKVAVADNEKAISSNSAMIKEALGLDNTKSGKPTQSSLFNTDSRFDKTG